MRLFLRTLIILSYSACFHVTLNVFVPLLCNMMQEIHANVEYGGYFNSAAEMLKDVVG